ncbi:hypothetical protein CWO91_36070 [Bradyrhizobium genosp. SA-3]|nr:hypothetical protein CWO91_36070 [Bradyrhizobium genosp. SA-3]
MTVVEESSMAKAAERLAISRPVISRTIANLEHMLGVTLRLSAGEWRNPMIHATCHTADNVRCIEFDATPWFNEADAPSIIDLAQRGWASTAIADSLEGRRGYERLHDLVEYAAKRLQSESLEDPTWETFECVVDGPEAVAWLEKNRPDVVTRIR